MATFLDRFVVEIGLDPKAFVKGTGDTMGALKKTREAATKEGTGIEKSMDGAAEAVDRLARNFLKLFALVTAGRAIKDFVADVTSADAAMGRLAKSIGSTPEAISSLANAVARNGGSASAAAGSFERLSDSINELKTTGNSSILPVFGRLQGISGRQIRLNTDLATTFGDIAEAAKVSAERIGVSQTSYLLKQAGYDQGTIALLIQGRAKLNEALEKSRRIGIVNEKDVKAAQALETSIESLRQTSEGFGRTILTALSPTITGLLKQLQDWIAANRELIAAKLAEMAEEFAKFLRQIPWGDVIRGVRDFAKGANEVAQAMGGWKVVAEAFFALWAASRIAALFAPLLLQIAGVRLALLGLGPFGAALLGLGALAGVAGLATADQLPKVLGREGAAGVDPGTGGATERPPMDLYGHEGGARPWLRRQWGRVKRLFTGGSADAAEGGAGIRTRADRSRRRGAEADKSNYNFTGENADVLRQAAKELGTSPEDLATVISYESKFKPNVWGGKGGNYMGLIQFGASERAQFGASDKQSFKEQMPAVVRFLKTRGFKPGMGLEDLYSTISAGEPGHPNRSDGYNTVRGHAAKMRITEAERVKRFLGASGSDAASAKTAASATGNPDGSPLPTDGTGVNNDLMRVVKRAQEISTVKFHIHEGLRTLERQKEMVDRGWSKTYNSKHLTGRAVDLRADGDPAVGALDPAKYAKINDAMKKAAAEAGVPIQWGGDSFGKFKDVPHFQLPDSFKSNAGAYGADPAKVSALNAQRAGAQAALAQTQAAQAAMVSQTSNDNRSTDNSSQWHIENLNLQTAATDGRAAAHDFRNTLSNRAYVAAANRGLA